MAKLESLFFCSDNVDKFFFVSVFFLLFFLYFLQMFCFFLITQSYRFHRLIIVFEIQGNKIWTSIKIEFFFLLSLFFDEILQNTSTKMKDCWTDWIGGSVSEGPTTDPRGALGDPRGALGDPRPQNSAHTSRWYGDEHGVDVGGVTVVDILACKAYGLGPIVISGHSPENLRFGSGL